MLVKGSRRKGSQCEVNWEEILEDKLTKAAFYWAKSIQDEKDI